MTERSKQTSPKLMKVICVLVLASLVIWVGCKKQPAGQADAERPPQPEPVNTSGDEFPKPDVGPPSGPKVSLNDVIKAAKTWDPSFTTWFGKPAPDFSLTDITGKEHKLSDYRGKDIVLMFWATWCPTCRAELPHLIELRDKNPAEKLAVLAVSRENATLLERFVAREKINFPVISSTVAMPVPYGLVQYIPSTFFIDPQSKIKLAATGVVPLDDIKAVLRAE